MAKIDFSFKGKITSIICSEDEIIESICKEFADKIEIDINNLQFIYQGNNLNFHLPLSQIANNIDKARKILLII